jgi:hypothetical protein
MPDASRARRSTAKKKPAKTKRTRRPAGTGEQVDQLCRLWRTILAKHDALSEAAGGNERHAANARASLARLDKALAEYIEAQRGQSHLKRIADRWCGDQRVEALRVTEDLLRAILGEATGGTLRSKWARLMKRVRQRGDEVVFRQLGEREVLAAYAREVREVLRVLSVSRPKLNAALVLPDVQDALFTSGARAAALTLLRALGFGSVATSYRKLAEYAFEHHDGIVEVRTVPPRLRPKRSRGTPNSSRKSGR